MLNTEPLNTFTCIEKDPVTDKNDNTVSTRNDDKEDVGHLDQNHWLVDDFVEQGS